MDDPRATCSHTGCGHCLHRRGSLKRCGAVLAAGLAGAAGAEEPKPQKSRVGLVFLSNSQGREMWPYPNFDCEKRHQVLLGKLRDGCPQVECRRTRPASLITPGTASPESLTTESGDYILSVG